MRNVPKSVSKTKTKMTKENMRHVLRLDKKQTKNSWHYTLNACFIHSARIEVEPTEKEKKKTTMKVPFRISPGSWTGFVLLDEPNGPRLRRARDGDRPRVAQERIQGIETLPQIPGPRSAGQKKKGKKKSVTYPASGILRVSQDNTPRGTIFGDEFLRKWRGGGKMWSRIFP